MKVAIVHDWLVGGGAEKVVQELHNIYPEAPIYTSYCSKAWRDKLDGQVVTGFLQKWPFGPLRKYVGVLRILWFRSLNFSGYDLVISSSGNGEAKQIKVPKGTTHICYCHTPTHYYWRHYDQYLANPGFGVFNPIARLGLRLLTKPLRKLDYQAAQNVDFFIANSSHIQRDIKTYYNKESTVIHPPVETKLFSSPAAQKRTGYITVGRQTPYKHTELVVQACTDLELPLLVIGNGPDHNKLVKIAGPTVSFIKWVEDPKDLAEQISKSQVFIFAAEEDFGIAPVEALATGTPVIAYAAGGALDYVTPNKTGVLFPEQTVESLKTALLSFDASVFSHVHIKEQASKFGVEHFRQRFLAFVSKELKKEVK
ncbi:MAG TPA: glycosyltransferase [Candidatus Saccharibacteria bacterium]|nr:glycosyltransferase [Candidatus Saccharibacteria bacterium]